MSGLLQHWNAIHVMQLASAPNDAAAIYAWARPELWHVLKHDGFAVWGVAGDAKVVNCTAKLDLLQIQAGRAGFACTDHKSQPCDHTLALLLLYITHPECFTMAAAPGFVTDWLGADSQKAREQYERTPESTSVVLDPVNIAQRFRAVSDGLKLLEQWLIDLLEHGLANAPITTYAFWDEIANRMIDAYVPGLANWLRELASIPLAEHDSDRIEHLLAELGRLYLLTHSFARFDAQRAEVQADLRAAVGWPLTPHEVYGGSVVADRWHVIGIRQFTLSDHTRSQRVWLRGSATCQFALIDEVELEPFKFSVPTGSSFAADLRYQPSGAPLRVLLPTFTAEPAPDVLSAGDTIAQSIDGYSHALSQNPWLSAYPMLLETVIPVRFAGGWVLREANGTYLPIDSAYINTWSLLAISGNHPISIAGEWNGRSFYPLSVGRDTHMVDLMAVENA